MKTRTPHQKIVRAATRGTGLRLTPEEVWKLGVMDDAIVQAAQCDDERDTERVEAAKAAKGEA